MSSHGHPEDWKSLARLNIRLKQLPFLDIEPLRHYNWIV